MLVMPGADAYRGRLWRLVFVRPGELRGARWSEFDLDGAEWRIPAERMKMGEQHIVPLARQAVAILRELKALTSFGEYVFPSLLTPRTRHRTRYEVGTKGETRHAIYRAQHRGVSTAVRQRVTDVAKQVVTRSFHDPARSMLLETRKVMSFWLETYEISHAAFRPS
jgi:integrase